MAVMIVLTMFSRNYIGVHTPQDVLVGALLGILVVIGGSFAWKWVEEHPKWDFIVPAAAVVLSAAFLLYINLKSYPMDYTQLSGAATLLVDPQKMMKDGFKDVGRFLGVAVAWFLERRFIKFSTDVSTGRKVTRCAFGILILLLFEQVLTPSLTGLVSGIANSWLSFFFTFLELVILIAGYPLLFTKWEAWRDKIDAKKRAQEESAETAPDAE